MQSLAVKMRLYFLSLFFSLLFSLTPLFAQGWSGEKTVRSEPEWRSELGEARFEVMRKKGKERAFSGEYLYQQALGTYHCAACDIPLFKSEDKYDSGSGWPSFTQPIFPKNIYYLEDWSLSFKRYEVVCSGCDSHLGHVFKDGPPPKYLRYCIASLSLRFYKK